MSNNYNAEIELLLLSQSQPTTAQMNRRQETDLNFADSGMGSRSTSTSPNSEVTIKKSGYLYFDY